MRLPSSVTVESADRVTWLKSAVLSTPSAMPFATQFAPVPQLPPPAAFHV